MDEVRRDSPTRATSDDPENPNQRLCDAMNAGEGTLTGYDCPVCKNKGVNYRLSPDTGSIVAVNCKCKAIREAKKNAQNSGLGDMLERCTMDTYRADLPWQRSALQTVQDFLSSPDGNWLYVGGQVGSGKTHLCAAATGELLRLGIRARVCDLAYRGSISAFPHKRSGIQQTHERACPRTGALHRRFSKD